MKKIKILKKFFQKVSKMEDLKRVYILEGHKPFLKNEKGGLGDE